jgi:hypothetical protein
MGSSKPQEETRREQKPPDHSPPRCPTFGAAPQERRGSLFSSTLSSFTSPCCLGAFAGVRVCLWRLQVCFWSSGLFAGFKLCLWDLGVYCREGARPAPRPSLRAKASNRGYCRGGRPRATPNPARGRPWAGARAPGGRGPLKGQTKGNGPPHQQGDPVQVGKAGGDVHQHLGAGLG